MRYRTEDLFGGKADVVTSGAGDIYTRVAGEGRIEGERSRGLRGSVLGLALSFGLLASAYPQAANQTAFKSAGGATWTVPAYVTRVDVLVVGGGGGGGSFGGGGGAGGLIYKNDVAVAPGTTIGVTVGAGGSGGPVNGGNGTTLMPYGSNGADSVFGTLTALGGGGGGSRKDYAGSVGQPGMPGGSGGGGSQNNPASAGQSEGGASLQSATASGGYGNAGGRGKYGTAGVPNHGGGGGGGAGWPGRAVVENMDGFGGIGGDGLYVPQFSTLGDSGWFAGGGGGIIYDNGQQFNYGGRGGGGRGGWSSATVFGGSAGTANTGGGGGSGRYTVAGFAGGSGVVVVDYAPRLTANLPTDGFYHTTGTASDAKGITVTAYNLTGNVTVYAPTGYEVSATSGGSYASTLTLTPSSGVVSTTIYLRIAAATIFANPTGTVTLSTSGLANTSVDLNVFRLVFTNIGDNSFTMPSHVSKVDLLVVGGGGGGGTDMGGGGGGGGVIYTKAYTVSPGTQYKAVVGAGGRGGPAGASPVQVGENGGNSQFGGNGSAALTAIGGGAGASGHRGDNGGPAVSARTGGSG